MKMIVPFLGLVFALPVHATILIDESFESQPAGTRLIDFGPDWFGTTGTFKVGNTLGLAATGNQYLEAPSRAGAGSLVRYGWFDASAGFNSRPSGENILLESVAMFIPNVTESTYGGMVMFDQLGDTVAVIGVDMLTGMTLTSATADVNNVAVNLGQYNNIQLVADYASGLVRYLFNGSLIGSTQMSAASLSAGLGDFDFYNNGFNATSSVAFRYDDYVIRSVPEPATGALMVWGLAGLCAVYRRRSAR